MVESKFYAMKKIEGDKLDMINDTDLTNKLRLAICMSDSSYTNIKYDKPEMYEY